MILFVCTLTLVFLDGCQNLYFVNPIYTHSDSNWSFECNPYPFSKLLFDL